MTDGAHLEDSILELLARRRRGLSICPSEVARALAPDDWRPLMSAIREAADRLAARGAVEVVQRGLPVIATTARGPIRIRRA